MLEEVFPAPARAVTVGAPLPSGSGREHGHQISDRGRIPSSVLEAYENDAS